MTHRNRGLAATIAAVVLALTFAACGSDSNSSSSSSSSGSSSGSSSSSGGDAGVQKAADQLKPVEAAPTKILQTEPLKGTPPKGKTLVMLGTADPNNKKLQDSLKSMAGLVGWNYSVVSYDPANPATFNAAVNTALTKHADYVAEAGVPLTPQAIKRVQDGNAKWVLTSVAPADVKDPIIVNANAADNDAQMGKVLADFFISDSKGKGNIVIEHVPAYPILGAFTDGFQQEVKALCPGCKVAIQNITIPDLTAGKVPSVMVSALRKNPDADYVGFDVGPFAAGINSALSAAGMNGKVKIIGEAADEAALAALQSGAQTAGTGVNPVYLAHGVVGGVLRRPPGLPVGQGKAGHP